MIELKKEFTTRELRQFGALVWPAFCGMIGWLCWSRGDWPNVAIAIWALGGVGAVVGVHWPAAIAPVYRALLLATFPIGWVMTHLVLGVLYYLIVTPIGLIRRALGVDALERRLDPTAATYWVPHRSAHDAQRYFRQY